MPSIKHADGTIEPDNPCSEHRDRSPGIIFKHGSNGELYIPYPLLTLIEFKSERELEFRFSFCTVCVRGERLKSVFDHAARGEIIKLNPNDRGIAMTYKQPHISSIEMNFEENIEPFFPGKD